MPWMRILNRAPVSPTDAAKRLALFVEENDGIVHADVLMQMQMVQQSIVDHTGLAVQRKSGVIGAPPPSPVAAPAEATVSAVENADGAGDEEPSGEKKKWRKLTKKALKKLPGGCGTSDEVCSAAGKLGDEVPSGTAVAAALKQLLKRKEVAKTGEKRAGQPEFKLL